MTIKMSLENKEHSIMLLLLLLFIAVKMGDFDTKDVVVIAEEGQSYYPSWKEWKGAWEETPLYPLRAVS